MPAALLLLTLLGSAALTGAALKYARRRLQDRVTERSSHTVPTPRGGGIAVVVAFYGALLALALLGLADRGLAIALALGGLPVAAIGWLDDHRPVPAKVRLLVQAVSAGMAISALGGLPDWPMGFGTLHLGMFGTLVAGLVVVWLTNLFNFMDGIDGIASSEAAFIASAYGLLAIGSGFSGAGLPAFALLAAVLGFLAWNWPPARIFMGDVCSAFLGMVFGIFAVHAMVAGITHFWVWLILPSVFLVDATITLITRIRTGQKWSEPHRLHAFQIAARKLKSHRPVTVGVIVLNLGFALPAYLAHTQPRWGWVLGLGVISLMGLLVVRIGAGHPDRS